MRIAALFLACMLVACVSARPVKARVDPHQLDVCTAWDDASGSYTLPDPCRYEVAPGEWLTVRQSRPQPSKAHGKLWWFFLALLI